MQINGAALAAIRERSGLSQTGLSERTGIDQSHISAIERGAKPNVRPATATTLAKALKVPLDALIADQTHEGVAS